MEGQKDRSRFQESANPREPVAQIEGFEPHELVSIKSSDLNIAAEELGRRTSELTLELLDTKRMESDYQTELGKANESLHNLRSLSENYSEVFTTSDGVNHLKNYLIMLEGYCEGVGITDSEGALLQIEDTTGCETLIVKNNKTGEIAGIHTEEDSDSYARSGDPGWGKRWVTMTIGEREIQFCFYSGVCSWGGASGVVTEKGHSYFQAADTLGLTTSGDLWANAVAFMFMDTADINEIQKMVQKMKGLPRPIFSSGYIIHMIDGRDNTVKTLEFGGDDIDFIEPVASDNRTIQVGTNYPNTRALRKIDTYNLPQKENESEEEYNKRRAERWAMKRRIKRLTKIGQLVGRNKDSLWGKDDVLKTAGNVMRNPHGDVVSEWFTGLSNDLVAQYDLLYVSPEGKLSLVVKKGYPELRKKK